MKAKRFTEEQIVSILKQAQAGMKVAELWVSVMQPSATGAASTFFQKSGNACRPVECGELSYGSPTV